GWLSASRFKRCAYSMNSGLFYHWPSLGAGLPKLLIFRSSKSSYIDRLGRSIRTPEIVRPHGCFQHVLWMSFPININ
ncbi:hypothetical protein, partial [Pseudomonas aeruginosa]|uniref:hypothetical protein n=1 Tax=Pseudomonas aeruginosa TaxID=287 RepID=UPI001C378EED